MLFVVKFVCEHSFLGKAVVGNNVLLVVLPRFFNIFEIVDLDLLLPLLLLFRSSFSVLYVHCLSHNLV